MTDPTPPALSTLPRPLALVLSGGASLGALQVGQIQAVAEVGLTPDLIVGTSVGAINGVFMAGAFTAARAKALASIWLGLRRKDVFGDLGLGAVLRLLRDGGTLSTPTGLETLIRTHLPRSHSDLAVAAHVVAVDILTGRIVILSDGDLHRNVLASSAIPSVFPPVQVDGRLLVDGGLSANVPLLPAAQLGARSMIVLDAGYPCSLTTPPRGLVAGILHTLALALRNQVQAALPTLAREHAIVYLPAPCPMSTSPHDFSRTKELLAMGRDLARDFLREIAVEVPGVCGHPHFHQPPDAAAQE